MTQHLAHQARWRNSPWTVALAGMVALAVAMGIGRFAFTPLLPMMLHDQWLDLPQACWLASANYLGYLVGALLCMLQPKLWRRFPSLPPFIGTHWLRGGLVATGLLTLSMALPLPALWPWLRFLAGVASAFVFVQTSGWCLAQLGRLGVPQMGGVIYTGPGLGIVVSGLSATVMVAQHGSAQTGWCVFGALALVLCALIWRVFQPMPNTGTAGTGGTAHAVGTTGAATSNTSAEAHVMAPTTDATTDTLEMGTLTLAYGLAGFGYIITATFLPVIARAALPESVWLDLFWPLFGAGVVAGALLATRMAHAGDNRLLLTGCYVIQAAGVLASVVWPTLLGFALSSWLLGLPFTAITFFAMQEVRRLRHHQAASTMGLLTAVYGLGQIAGPPMANALIHRGPGAAADFNSSLLVAAGSLLLGAILFGAMSRRFPAHNTKATHAAQTPPAGGHPPTSSP